MAKNTKNTRTALFLNLGFTVLELVGGIISGSVAILADALHDFADSLALGAGWYFENKSQKGSNEKYSYGYARFSLLGAMINAVALFLGSIYIIYASVNRIIHPEMPKVYWMLGTAILGIAMNGLGAWKLKSGKSMNQEVMTIHLLEDAVGWLAVLIASIVLIFVDIPILDPILAIVINLVVLIFVMSKLVQALKIMLQRVPKEINLPELHQKILCLDGVNSVSHLHVWALNKEKMVVSVHVQVQVYLEPEKVILLKQEIKWLFSDYETEHITIDVENQKLTVVN